MPSHCLELEHLDRHAAAPEESDPAIHEHLSDCAACRARLSELMRNQALFSELHQVGPVLFEKLPPTAPPPTAVADIQIVREIGRGGMGVVYEAMQHRPQRRVALKLLRREYAASEDRIRLFNREIRALAKLRHPGITAIYESGASADGPYFLMEFVGGVPLTEYARRRRPELHDRLRLFLQVCSAISYAHQHGVIHRDLKPSNILVEDDGAPKVLDFGLARIVDADATACSIAMDTHRIAGTLAYMSPEQTRGEPDEIDVRSDLYSLGIILYELLTGQLPYDIPHHSVPVAIRSICESPPARPSLAAADRRDARLLVDDLETVMLKAIEKSPENRYQSVAALADDISRYLSKEPIIARPPSRYYQFKRFAQRNRVLIGGACAVFVALAAGTVTTGWQAYRARAAERVALDESATNAEINRFLATMFSSVDPAVGGPDVRVVEILRKAAGQIEPSFANRPRVASALRAAIGRAFQSLTLYDEAEPHIRAAVKLATGLLGPEDRETLSLRYSLSLAMLHTNQVQPAYEEMSDVARVQERVLGPDDRDTLLTRHLLGVIETELGRTDAAEAIFRDVLQRRTRALGPQDKDTLQTHSDLGLLLRRSGQFEESDRLARECYDIALRTFGADDPQTILYAGYVAMIARTQAEFEAVEPQYRDIVERATRVYGPDHQVTISFRDSLAALLELRGKYAEAEIVARGLHEQLSASRGAEAPLTIAAMKRLGHLLTLQAKYVEAEPLVRKMLEVSRRVYGESSRQAGDAMHDLVHVLNGGGKWKEGLEVAERALALRIALEGDAGENVALTRTQMSEMLVKLGCRDEAQAAADAALASLKARPGVDPILIAWAERNVGVCLRENLQFESAERLLLSAAAQLEQGLGAKHPFCIETRKHLETLHEMQRAEPR